MKWKPENILGIWATRVFLLSYDIWPYKRFGFGPAREKFKKEMKLPGMQMVMWRFGVNSILRLVTDLVGLIFNSLAWWKPYYNWKFPNSEHLLYLKWRWFIWDRLIFNIWWNTFQLDPLEKVCKITAYTSKDCGLICPSRQYSYECILPRSNMRNHLNITSKGIIPWQKCKKIAGIFWSKCVCFEQQWADECVNYILRASKGLIMWIICRISVLILYYLMCHCVSLNFECL
jgi:hypothetical protein